MRIATWNCCRGSLDRKVSALEGISPDIAIIQECAEPEVKNSQCLWFGDNPKQGILVKAYGDYRLEALQQKTDAPKFVIPVKVTGPREFVLFAVWSKKNKEFRYVQGIVRCLQLYESIFQASPCVVAGDFNSNTIWDKEHPTTHNHSALVKRLRGLGLVSAYHHFYSEEHGSESDPTYHFHWKEEKPFHIDYCFIPKTWLSSLKAVSIGSFLDWIPLSDHRPLMIEVSDS